MTCDQIEGLFADPKFNSKAARVLVGMLRTSACMLAQHINEHCPDSREKNQAVIKLQECIMWATESIIQHDVVVDNNAEILEMKFAS